MDIGTVSSSERSPDPGVGGPLVDERAQTPVSDSQGSSKKRIQEKESFQRINYLFQAAYLMAAQAPNARSVSAYYSSMIHGIAIKSLLRLYPSMKRQMCRGCECLLLPGITARVRLKSLSVRCCLWTCLTCGTVRRFPGKRGYQLWVEKHESAAEEH